MKLVPLHDRILVARIEADKTSPGGIAIPESATQKTQQGEVVAVGPGRLTEQGARLPMSVAIGDRVMFGMHYGHTVDVNGSEVLMLHDHEVFAVVHA